MTQVTTYVLYASNGRRIRKATRVIFPSGERVNFLDRLPKRKAIEQARRILGKRRLTA